MSETPIEMRGGATSIFQAAQDWEASRTENLEKSEQRAWRVAIAFGVGMVLSWVALVLLMPLKEISPFLIREDSVTGVPDIVTMLKEKTVGYDEIMDKYWVSAYVRSRETYDWYTLQNDYDTTQLLSSSNVATEYSKLFEGPEALDKKYGSTIKSTVKILSIVPNKKGVATVRFSKHTKRVDLATEDVSKWVATVSYEYQTSTKMKESLRLVNPLGFRASSYRVDPELTGDAK